MGLAIMLNSAENIPVENQPASDTLDRLAEQAQHPLLPEEFLLTNSLSDLIEESLGRGWIFSTDLQELISAMDRRLASFDIDELAHVFDVEEVQVWSNSTRSIPTRSHGAVALRNAAFLLIQLKAMGFRVDDTLLTSRLRPLLATKKFLMGREFYVFWQQTLEAKRKDFVLYCAPVPHNPAVKEARLPLGHVMRTISDGSRIVGVEVTPPPSSEVSSE
jgi:hypothetical protein